jgi:hypothetical protein
MHIDQLEDRIVEPRLRAIQRSMPRLARQQGSEDAAGADRAPAIAADGPTCGELACRSHNTG